MVPDAELIVIDPGHFHVALVQQRMYPGVAPLVRVYAPLGPDLLDYLARIARFNARAENPTSWRLALHAGPDFLDRLRAAPPGGIAILSGRNSGKIDLVAAAVAAGHHVLADKPMIIRRADFPALEAVLRQASAAGLVVADMMGGRHEVTGAVLRHLHGDPEIFGNQLSGTAAEPGVAMTSLHHLCKLVAGMPNPRPPWYFDIEQQGEALADIGTHLVDRVHETLFPGQALDDRDELRILAATRWPTPISAAQFRQVTDVAPWPDYLAAAVSGDVLAYVCNNRLLYRVRGIHVGLDMQWHWQSDGGDTHTAIYSGDRARLEIRQDAAEDYRPELYVLPEADIAKALARRIAALQPAFPGLGVERRETGWRVIIPAALRLGHDAHFIALTKQFLGHVARPQSIPPSETVNLLAKYYVCSEGVALARSSAPSSAPASVAGPAG